MGDICFRELYTEEFKVVVACPPREPGLLFAILVGVEDAEIFC